MPISPVFEGYSYQVKDENRQKVLENLSDLYAYAEDWTQAISSLDDNLYGNGVDIAKEIHDRYETFLEDVLTGSVPITSAVMYLLAPPGNRYAALQASTIDENNEDIDTSSPGLLWNVWAAYEMYSPAYTTTATGSDINNYWNNTYAQGDIPNSNTTSSAYTTPPPAPSTVTTYIHSTDSSSDYPNFATVPILDNTPASNEGVYNSNNLDYRMTNYTLSSDQDFKNFLTQSIYDYRSLATKFIMLTVQSMVQTFALPVSVNGDYDKTVSTTTTDGTTTTVTNQYFQIFDTLHTMKRPAVQDILFYEYTRTGESQLQRQLSVNTDQIGIGEQGLEYLFTLNKFLNQDIDVNRQMKPRHTNSWGNGTTYNASLWALRDYLLSGYSQLNILYSNGIVTDSDTISMMASLLSMFQPAASNIRVYYAGGTTDETVYQGMSNLFTGQYVSAGLLTSINAGLSTNTVNYTIAQFQNLNTTLKQDLDTSVYIYQEFVESAAKMLSQVQTVLRSIIQDISGN
jgi:hypothetical protein